MEHYAGLRRDFGRKLTALNANSGLTQEAIGRAMKVSTAKVSRIMHGNMSPWADVRLLAEIMDASQDEIDELDRIWTLLRHSRPRFAGFADILSNDEIEFHESLMFADIAWINGGMLIPMVARTATYHQAVTFYHHPTRIERWIELLPLVQEITNPSRELSMVLDESIFLRWSTPGFHEQLDALLGWHETGARIQVLPLKDPAAIALHGPFAMMFWNGHPEATRMCVGWAHKAVDWVASSQQENDLRSAWSRSIEIATDPDLLPAIIELAHSQTKGAPRTVIPR